MSRRWVSSLLGVVVAGLLLLAGDPVARACQCAWNGAFLVVAPNAPLIVRGRVTGHLDRRGGSPFAMQVEILEVLKGQMSGRLLRVAGDEGWLCRPSVSRFPVGTEWVLALDGPGSKPAMTLGHALSICGQYWLRVDGERVIGPAEPGQDAGTTHAMPLAELRRRLREELGRERAAFGAEVRAGQTFERPFGPSLVFRLAPGGDGWTVEVRETGGTEDLSRLTPPWHATPNPRIIQGWQFCQERDRACEEQAAARNAPAAVREFIFSLEVGKTIDGPGARRQPAHEEVERIRRFGRGALTVLAFRVGTHAQGQDPSLEWMRFTVELTWPAAETGR